MRKTITFFIFIVLLSCESNLQKEERLARKYCSSCHSFPDPSLLDKGSWENGVLPQMAFLMGFQDLKISMSIRDEDFQTVYNSIPNKPMVSDEEWLSIKNYFITHAPDSLNYYANAIDTTLHQFSIAHIKNPENKSSLVSLLKFDSINDNLFIGTRSAKLYQFAHGLRLQDSFKLESPASHILIEKDKPPMLSLMGIMDPSEQAKGQIITLTSPSKILIDSLKRPVHFEQADMNGDGLDDIIVCAFGNYTGALLLYENLGRKKFKKHTLYGFPGARNVIVLDINNDGLKDILFLMTQGNEQISLLTNSNNFNFRIKTLLRFPPVYGSSYFDIADFNGDGNFDILYTNGDNADYSPILKPYHGIRIFMNDGKNNFKQSWFHAMYGATKALARDFDNDGDLDIAAIAFFADFNRHPENGFAYLENKGNNNFLAHASIQAATGRWLLMDAADIDNDGDIDLMLGALNFPMKVPNKLLMDWYNKKTSVLILKNKKVL